MNNGNEELMNWALENLSENDWDDEWTHLRSDKSDCPIFLTKGSDYYWIINGDGEWVWEGVDTSADFECVSSDKITIFPKVISREEFLQKLKEKNTMSELFGKKYRVNPETSELLQKAVFEAGGKWMGIASNNISYTNESIFIFVRENGTMSRTNDEESFYRCESPEAKIEVIKSIKIHPVESKENEDKESLREKLEDAQKVLDDLKKELEKL